MQARNEKNKVLILGCSFTQGSYKLNDVDHSRETIETNYGWYDHLDIFSDREIDVYSFGGGGYAAWAEILKDLETNNTIKNYDTVIIQETTEPRLGFRKQSFEWLVNFRGTPVDRHLKINHYQSYYQCPHSCFTIHPDTLKEMLTKYYNISSVPVEWILDIGESKSPNKLVDICKSYIENLLKKNNIKVYVFSLFGHQFNSEYFHRLDLEPMLYDKLKTSDIENLSTTKVPYPAHLSLKGNIALGKIVNNALKENLDKKGFLNYD